MVDTGGNAVDRILRSVYRASSFAEGKLWACGDACFPRSDSFSIRRDILNPQRSNVFLRKCFVLTVIAPHSPVEDTRVLIWPRVPFESSHRMEPTQPMLVADTGLRSIHPVTTGKLSVLSPSVE